MSIALRLITAGYRPFPIGHSLPDFVMVHCTVPTRCGYEGEPRHLYASKLAQAEPQDWVPAWADHVVRVFGGACGERESRQEQTALVVRDKFLFKCANEKQFAGLVVTVCEGRGYDGVAHLLGLDRV